MAERYQPIMFPIGNVGFATDMPIQVRQLSHLITAQNCIYELSGAVRKVGGDSRINATAITGGPSITGMFDFWRGGGAAAFTQKHVVMTSNQKVYKDDMDGTYDDITGAASITASAIPVFCQARDLLTIWTDKNDTPLKWNQTGNVAALGGTPPVGRGMTFHVNRGFAWGVNANASRLYYSSSTDVEDWSGSDTGSIDIDPEDGDRIIGCISYKRRLFIFKGPNKGSIHILAGTAPTGADGFSRTKLVSGIALQTHNSILEISDDIWFMSDRGIHSLSATQDFGDFQGAFLSRFLNSYFRDTITRGSLNKVWGCHYALKGCALWVLPTATSTTNNTTLGASYWRLQEDGIKWFTWSRSAPSCAIRINPTSLVKEVVFGSSAGFALIEDQNARAITSNTAYNLQLTTPWVMTGEIDAAGQPKPYNPANLERMSMRSISVGNYDVTVQLTSDMGAGDNYAFNQGANITSATGTLFNDALFGVAQFSGATSTAGPQFGFRRVKGQGRAVKLDVTQGGLNQDAHLYEIAIEKTPVAFTEVL